MLNTKTKISIITRMDQIPDIWITGLFAGGESAISSEEKKMNE